MEGPAFLWCPLAAATMAGAAYVFGTAQCCRALFCLVRLGAHRQRLSLLDVEHLAQARSCLKNGGNMGLLYPIYPGFYRLLQAGRNVSNDGLLPATAVDC
jgi:hypothetical protein